MESCAGRHKMKIDEAEIYVGWKGERDLPGKSDI